MNNNLKVFSIVFAAALAITSFAAQKTFASQKKTIVLSYCDIAVSGFIERMVAERKRVRAWWGKGFSGPIRVEIRDSYRISKALIPAWRGDRGRMEISLRTVESGTTATLHEIVHVEAPNGNRFLAEGFAVFLQEKLNGVSGYPTFGRDLHEAAQTYSKEADINDLDSMEVPERLNRIGYIVAGSFVRFLVETQGKEKFRKLYALTPFSPGERITYSAGRYKIVYGKSLDDLAQEWRKIVGQ